ncbi:peptidase C53 family protein [Tieghemostelium lacteum]|uniref:Peptidase C53 family protein n=1 Tax=Tieghemostelium lacteum TaxID=361077 RepID=A0A151Z2R5_TIELA|nr:peptidase C53 family protein [Tieghemostelium lacteum]|eukprot:KYQ88241.1 peptidase C53 family protein [Tieghemostelium lacteum]
MLIKNKLIVVTSLLLLISICNAKFYQELKWKQMDEKVSDHHPMFFKIYLKHQNLDKLNEKVRDVSSPKSPNYTEYLTSEEIMSIIAPAQESSDSVKKWIQSYNPITIVDEIDVLKVSMSKKNVEKMFNIKIHKFEHAIGGFVLRSLEDPAIQHKLKQHIDLITGISTFPIIKDKKVRENQDILSSSQPTTGLNILGLLGYGLTSQVSFTPSCSPNCTSMTTNPVNVYIHALNTVFPQNIQTLNIQPTCTNKSGVVNCQATFNSIPFLPSQVSIFDTITQESTDYPYAFISTPVITPQLIKDYYGVPSGYRVTTNITQCVVEFESQFMATSDLDAFFQEMGLPWDYQLSFVGPNNLTNPGVEATLDIQYIMGIAPGAPTTFWSIYSNSTFTSEGVDDILSWATAAFSSSNPPLVNSLSYGIAEQYVDQFLGNGYLQRSEIEFQKLALLGISMVVSSMDSGAAALGPQPPMSQSCAFLSGGYPSLSPYVTSVGAIYFTPLDQPICYESVTEGGIDCFSQPVGEVGVSIDYGMQWTSGGSFSNITSTAYYQVEAVERYLSNYSSVLPPAALFNKNGRAYPDVSTVGHNLYIYYNGAWMTVDGTSASAPIFAGLITILNDIRLKAGLNPLGFINPLLYQIAQDYPEAFYDVTVGDNRCGIYNMPNAPTCCPHGFQSTPGYDIPSGIGRPNMQVLMDIITKY